MALSVQNSVEVDGCPICFEPWEEQNTPTPEMKKIRTVCSHYFHEQCLNRWKNHKGERLNDPNTRLVYRVSTCPLCRQRLSLEILDNQKNRRRMDKLFFTLLQDRSHPLNNLDFPVQCLFTRRLIYHAYTIGR